MMGKAKSFCVVCIANYCRSPVLEILLRKRYPDLEISSCGLDPLIGGSMDKRSQSFLEENGIDFNIHIPKKIDRRILSHFDYFLAIDVYVLTQLNYRFPNYRNKFLLATLQNKDIHLIDPYRFDNDKYMSVMQDIKFISENIDLALI